MEINKNEFHAVFGQAADWFVIWSNKAIAERGIFTVALSGGSTPRKLYELLASGEYQAQIDFTKVHFFFGDERNVQPDSDDSNYKMAHDALFSKINAPNVYRVKGELAAIDAANDYEQILRDFFQNETPHFDLILLGLGTDGHTASLFPDSPALDEQVRFFTENWVEKFGAYRLTLTLPAINNARTILFIVTGADKAQIVTQIMQSEPSEIKFPARRINPIDGKLIWLLDVEAFKNVND